MGNIYEYTVFDRDMLDPILDTKWSDMWTPGMGDFESVREFLVDYALDEQDDIDNVDKIMAETVRRSLELGRCGFSVIFMLLEGSPMPETFSVEIGEWSEDDAYGQILLCANLGFSRGLLTPATIRAVYALHSCWAHEVRPPKGICVDGPHPLMLPRMPELMPSRGDGVGVVQARLFINFLTRAWKEDWPIEKGKSPKTIRSCRVAGELAKGFRTMRMKRPCIYRWME